MEFDIQKEMSCCCSGVVPLGTLGSHDETVHSWSFAGHHDDTLLYPMTESLLMAVVTACWPTISLSIHIINYHWNVFFLKHTLLALKLFNVLCFFLSNLNDLSNDAVPFCYVFMLMCFRVVPTLKDLKEEQKPKQKC